MKYATSSINGSDLKKALNAIRLLPSKNLTYQMDMVMVTFDRDGFLRFTASDRYVLAIVSISGIQFDGMTQDTSFMLRTETMNGLWRTIKARESYTLCLWDDSPGMITLRMMGADDYWDVRAEEIDGFPIPSLLRAMARNGQGESDDGAWALSVSVFEKLLRVAKSAGFDGISFDRILGYKSHAVKFVGDDEGVKGPITLEGFFMNRRPTPEAAQKLDGVVTTAQALSEAESA